MSLIELKKNCNHCGKRLPLSDFYKKVDRLESTCKKCILARKKTRRDNLKKVHKIGTKTHAGSQIRSYVWRELEKESMEEFSKILASFIRRLDHAKESSEIQIAS